MKGHGSQFRRLLHKSVVAFLECPTLGEAARTVGVSRNTFSRWTHDADFKALLETVQNHMAKKEAEIRLLGLKNYFPNRQAG